MKKQFYLSVLLTVALAPSLSHGQDKLADNIASFQRFLARISYEEDASPKVNFYRQAVLEYRNSDETYMLMGSQILPRLRLLQTNEETGDWELGSRVTALKITTNATGTLYTVKTLSGKTLEFSDTDKPYLRVFTPQTWQTRIGGTILYPVTLPFVLTGDINARALDPYSASRKDYELLEKSPKN